MSMPTMTHLPAPKQVKDLFAELLDRDVTYGPAAPLTPGPQVPASVATYVDDALRITGVICCDLSLSAYAGAAIGLAPATEAAAAVEDGRLTDVLAENLYEVLNIAASMFNVDGATHVRLHSVHNAGAPMPADVQARALTLGRREDAQIDIAGYGGGRLSIVLV